MTLFSLLLLSCDRGTVTPGGPTLVDGTTEPDVDGDGYDADADCDDQDATVHPGASEVCANRVDDDCNGSTDAESEGCAWVGEWDPASADLEIPMSDGGQGSSNSQWATVGTVLAVPNGLHGLEFFDISAREAVAVGVSEELAGLDQASVLRSLGDDEGGHGAVSIATDAVQSATVSFGQLGNSLEFTPMAQLAYSLVDSTCKFFGLDATGLWTAGVAQATRVAVPCTHNGWPSPEAPPSFVYVFSTARTGDFTLADADLTIAGTFWKFGADVSASDLDADGLDDLVVGESDWVPDFDQYDQYGGANNYGRVFVFDGAATGSLTEEDADGFIDGVQAGVLGQNNAPVGDVDGDGYPDLAVGDGHGAYLFRGPILEQYTVEDAWASWIPSDEDLRHVPGYTLAPAGDVDGDGGPDLLVGGPWNLGGTWIVYDLSEGVHPLEDGSGFISESGYCLAPGTDYDGDGRSDVVLGRTGGAMDTVSVFYGRER